MSDSALSKFINSLPVTLRLPREERSVACLPAGRLRVNLKNNMFTPSEAGICKSLSRGAAIPQFINSAIY